MTRIIKYVIGIVGLTIALLLAIPFFISLDTYKEIIALQVKKHTGRELKIDGKISFDILPTPQIKLTQLKLSSLALAKTANFLEIESVSGKLALSPLLNGKIVISSLELIKPIVNLERLKNGKGTWEFQRDKVANSSAPAMLKEVGNVQSKNSAASLPLIINDIRIQRGLLKYVDNDKYTYLEDLDLDITMTDISSPTNSESTNLGSTQMSKSRWSKERIDLSGLTNANISVRLKAKKLTHNALVFDNITMKSELDDGVLKIRSLAGELYGGKLDGSGSLSCKSNQPLALKLHLKNAQVQNIAPEGGRIKVIGGLIDFACDIQSYGFSQFDYVKNVRGLINLNGRDGKISGIDLHKLIHALDKPRDISVLASGLEEAIGKGETAFNSLKSDVSIDKGVMHITKCELISGASSAATQGKINLLEFTLDVFAIINSGVKYLPPITIHFYGPIDNPQHKIDMKAIWQNLVNNALTGVIDNLKQGKIKPRDLLKGIMHQGGSKSGDEDGKSKAEDAANQLLEKGIKALFK